MASPSLFIHECRCALREGRWLFPIPTLVTLAAIGVWHAIWCAPNEELNGAQRAALDLYPNLWPYAAWLVPYALLKFPDLRSPDALWRLTPASITHVFGARLTLAALATVVAPALAAYVAMAKIYPEIALDQMGVCVVNQWAWFVLGSFAALISRGHRGLLLVVAMGVSWMVGKHLSADTLVLFTSWRETPFQAFVDYGPWATPSLPTLALRYVLPLVVPVLALIPAVRGRLTARLRDWAIGSAALASVLTLIGIHTRPVSTVTVSETLPTAHLTLNPTGPDTRTAASLDEPLGLMMRRNGDTETGSVAIPYASSTQLPHPHPWIALTGQEYWSDQGTWRDGARSGRMRTANDGDLPRLILETAPPGAGNDTRSRTLDMLFQLNTNSEIGSEIIRRAIVAVIADPKLKITDGQGRLLTPGDSLHAPNLTAHLLTTSREPLHPGASLSTNAYLRQVAAPTVWVRGPALGKYAFENTAYRLTLTTGFNAETGSVEVSGCLRSREPLFRLLPDPGFAWDSGNDKSLYVLYNKTRSEARIVRNYDWSGHANDINSTRMSHVGFDKVTPEWLDGAELIVIRAGESTYAKLPVEITVR